MIKISDFEKMINFIKLIALVTIEFIYFMAKKFKKF